MRRAFLIVAMAVLALPIAARGADLPDIDGLVGLQTETGAGWLAILVPVPADSAVSGLMWYNNDTTTAFTGLLVATGHETGPGLIDDALEVQETFSGESLAWSEVVFTEPVGATLGRLYIVFAFPEGPGYVADGEGGGPAVGYIDGGAGSRGWISGDGEVWSQLQESYSFGIVPSFVALEEGMAVKRLEPPQDEAPKVSAAPSLTVGPNPFNPRVEIQFTLTREERVVVDVFDLRGQRVARVVDGLHGPGRHMATWTGRDDRGGPWQVECTLRGCVLEIW